MPVALVSQRASRQYALVPRRLPYRNGTWFAVPLRTAGFGLGVVAHHDRHGGVVGYFFAARLDAVPALSALTGLKAQDAVRVIRFGDLGLIKHDWPVIGELPGWDEDEWPLPDFGRRDMSGKAFRVVYSSHDLASPKYELQISDDECDRLPRDALSGSGAVERVLTHLLDGSA